MQLRQQNFKEMLSYSILRSLRSSVPLPDCSRPPCRRGKVLSLNRNGLGHSQHSSRGPKDSRDLLAKQQQYRSPCRLLHSSSRSPWIQHPTSSALLLQELAAEQATAGRKAGLTGSGWEASRTAGTGDPQCDVKLGRPSLLGVFGLGQWAGRPGLLNGLAIVFMSGF